MKTGTRLILISMALLGCTERKVKEEFETLLNSPGTATGSDFMIALCGRPTETVLHLESIHIRLFPGSGTSSGQGTAEISATGNRFSCKAEMTFDYGNTEVGGHGFGGTALSLRNFKRVGPVDSAIGNPKSARPIRLETMEKGALDNKSAKFPDGFLAEYFAIELNTPNPLLRFHLKGNEKGFNPKGYVYQEGRLVDSFSSKYFGTAPYDNVVPLEKGRAVILITAKEKVGTYTLLIDEPEDAARAMLRLPDRYKKKSH